MSGIKLKRWILLIIILLSLSVLGAGYLLTPQLIASSITKQEQAGDFGKALLLKERLIEYFPGSEEARWEAFELAESLFQTEERVIIGPDFTTGGFRGIDGQDIRITAEQAARLLEQVAEGQQETMWKNHTMLKLAEVYRLEGKYEQAEETFLRAAQSFALDNEDSWAAQAKGSLAEMYLQMDTEKALVLIEQSLREYPEERRADFLAQKGDGYYLQGDYDQAEQSYREALGQAELDWQKIQSHISESSQGDKAVSLNAELEQQPVYRHSKSRLEQISQLKGEGNVQRGSIQGQILSGNTAMPNVLVYLINEAEHDGRSNNLDGIAALPPVKTDDDGKFEFQSVASGRYFIALGVLPEDLEGLGRFKGLEGFDVESGQKVQLKYAFQPRINFREPSGQQSYKQGEELKISWDEVQEASSYNLHIALHLDNGYVSTVYRKSLAGNFYVFHPQGLALREMNFVARSDNILAPSAILGSFYPGAELYFFVEAIDKQGKSIADSEGYVFQLYGNYPSILVEGQGADHLSPGDRLVIEKKYAEAVQAYKKELEAKPSDPNILLSLARLYSYGWEERTVDQEITLGFGENPQTALDYYTKLLKNTREKFIIEEAASTAVQAGNTKLALELYEEIQGEFEAGSFWYYLMGELYFQNGQPDKALTYYLKYLEGQREFRDLGPVMALLYEDEVSGALTLLQSKDYSQRRRYYPQGGTEEPTDIKALEKHLESYRQGAPSILTRADFQKYLLEIIRIDGNNRWAQIETFQNNIKVLGEQDVLVKVLAELVKDRL